MGEHWCSALHRTDPGFGYAAFWRDAVGSLGLPDLQTAGAWGAGPEIGPLLALRPAARGWTVAEVASVAYPPVRRAGRADRARLRHWLRTAVRELGHSRGRHAATGPAPSAPARPLDNGSGYRPVMARPPLVSDETGAGRRALDRRAVEALTAERQAGARLARERTTLRLRNTPFPAWRDGHPERLGGPDIQQVSWRPAIGTPQPPHVGREVGVRRRRIQGNRQSQPDLRVIPARFPRRGLGPDDGSPGPAALGEEAGLTGQPRLRSSGRICSE